MIYVTRINHKAHFSAEISFVKVGFEAGLVLEVSIMSNCRLKLNTVFSRVTLLVFEQITLPPYWLPK